MSAKASGVCTGPECLATFIYSKGLCRSHYRQLVRGDELHPLKRHTGPAVADFTPHGHTQAAEFWRTEQGQRTRCDTYAELLRGKREDCSEDGWGEPLVFE